MYRDILINSCNVFKNDCTRKLFGVSEKTSANNYLSGSYINFMYRINCNYKIIYLIFFFIIILQNMYNCHLYII